MADFIAVLQRMGDGLGVILPEAVVHEEGIEEGKPVVLSIRSGAPPVPPAGS